MTQSLGAGVETRLVVVVQDLVPLPTEEAVLTLLAQLATQSSKTTKNNVKPKMSNKNYTVQWQEGIIKGQLKKR